jgi:hypothetical protein
MSTNYGTHGNYFLVSATWAIGHEHRNGNNGLGILNEANSSDQLIAAN